MVVAAVGLQAGQLAGAPTAGAAVFTPSTTASTAVGGAASLEVTGAGGPVTDVTVTLTGLSHPAASDLDLELVAPSGAAVALLSDACGAASLTDVTLTLDDSAPSRFGAGGACGSGTYRPTEVSQGQPADVWPVADPGASLARFDGENPNGTWTLHLLDDDGAVEGVLAGGFALRITTGGFRALLPGAGTAGPASAYPLRTGVADRTGTITGLSVTVRLSHASVGDLTLLLVSPGGRSVLLTRHPCATGVPVTGAAWTFSDAAPAPLPTGSDPAAVGCGTGTYRPAGTTWAALPTPAPGPPYAGTLGTLVGTSPNGSWQLYVHDDREGASGYLTEFSLSLATSDVTAPRTRIVSSPRTSHRHRGTVAFRADEPGARFECRLDGRRWRACTSPTRLTRLAPGLHRFKVRAVDAAGNRDESPAVRRWRVLRRS